MSYEKYETGDLIIGAVNTLGLVVAVILAILIVVLCILVYPPLLLVVGGVAVGLGFIKWTVGIN